MHKATKIELIRAEGKRPLPAPVVLTGEKLFERADKTIFDWSFTAPAMKAYDKCDIFITFDDDRRFATRYDLYRESNPRISDYIKRFLLVSSGESKPAHWTQEQYDMILNRNPKLKEEAKNWKAGYSFTD